MSNFFPSPEIIRYLRSEARPGRLVTGLITANLSALAIFLMVHRGKRRQSPFSPRLERARGGTRTLTREPLTGF